MKLPVPKNKKIIDYRDGYFKEVVPKWGNRKNLIQKYYKTKLYLL